MRAECFTELKIGGSEFGMYAAIRYPIFYLIASSIRPEKKAVEETPSRFNTELRRSH